MTEDLQELRKELRKDIRDIFKAVSEINISLVRVTDSVEHHIKRTDLLEEQIKEGFEESNSRLDGVENDMQRVREEQLNCPARISSLHRENYWKKNGPLIMAVLGLFSLFIAGATLVLQMTGKVNFTP